MFQKKSKNTSYIFLIMAGILTIVVVILLYRNTQELFKWSLQNRVTAIATTAALQFDPRYLDQIKDEDSIGTNAYVNTVKQLQRIRSNNKDLQFIYIQRSTDKPEILEFVADADSMDPNTPIDLNGDGIIDDSDALNSPGEEYDVSDYPEFIDIAFIENYVDDELSIDQWGTHLSATSPIFELGENRAKYLIGVDVDVSDFVRLTNLALIPFLLVAGFELLLLITLTIILVRMWGTRVSLLQELDRQKDAVVHMVAHQFKGPVTTINFTTELLLDGSYGELNPELKEQVQTIRSASQKMGSQSEMVLDAAKITSGKLPLESKPVDLNELMKEVVEEAENNAKQRKVNLKVSIPANLPTVMLDKKYTQLSIDNLLSNAVKYTALKGEGGNVEFIVELKKNTLHCTVKDSGIGIPQKDQEHIFKEMFRASNSGKEGNGLGLNVAMGAIKAQGGKMTFESTENVGTTFFVELPLKKA